MFAPILILTKKKLWWNPLTKTGGKPNENKNNKREKPNQKQQQTLKNDMLRKVVKLEEVQRRLAALLAQLSKDQSIQIKGVRRAGRETFRSIETAHFESELSQDDYLPLWGKPSRHRESNFHY